MENRISELKAKAQSLQKIMDDKEEILREISEKIGIMSKDLNEYQIKYENNCKQIPLVKDKLQKKEKIIEQEKHDQKIITEKLSQLQKLKVKLVQDHYKLEQKVQKKSPQVQPYNAQQGSPPQSKIQNYLPSQSQQNQKITVNQHSPNQKIEQDQQKQQKRSSLDSDTIKAPYEKKEVQRKESSNDEDEEEEKSDEDCDDILKRIQANLKNEKEEEEDDDDGDDEDEQEEDDKDSDNKQKSSEHQEDDQNNKPQEKQNKQE